MRKYKICVFRGDNCFSRAVDERHNTKLYGKQVGRVATYLTGTDVNISSSAARHIQRVLLSPACTEIGPSDIHSDLKLLTLFLRAGGWGVDNLHYEFSPSPHIQNNNKQSANFGGLDRPPFSASVSSKTRAVARYRRRCCQTRK